MGDRIYPRNEREAAMMIAWQEDVDRAVSEYTRGPVDRPILLAAIVAIAGFWSVVALLVVKGCTS